MYDKVLSNLQQIGGFHRILLLSSPRQDSYVVESGIKVI
jgi:hypothetical protein